MESEGQAKMQSSTQENSWKGGSFRAMIEARINEIGGETEIDKAIIYFDVLQVRGLLKAFRFFLRRQS